MSRVWDDMHAIDALATLAPSDDAGSSNGTFGSLGHHPEVDSSFVGSEPVDMELCLHSVHNVQHSPNESYYGMAESSTGEGEAPVTSERPARLTCSLDGLITVRVFLHERSAPSQYDRAIGHLVIPIREALEACGQGIYQTWFLLEDPALGVGGDRDQRPRVNQRFRRAMQAVTQELHAPRVCLTLKEASIDQNEWLRDEASRIMYFKTLLVSHAQHAEGCRAYFQHLERVILDDERRQQQTANGMAPVEAANLRAELERLQHKQRRQELQELQAELDHVTDEANRRIERGNDQIIKLKDQLKQLRDYDSYKVKDASDEGHRRLQLAQRRNAELKTKLEQQRERHIVVGGREEELAQLRQDVAVLAKQKTTLMSMVQEVYGNAKAKAAAATASVGTSDDHSLEMSMLLPDPREIMGGQRRR